MPKTRIVIADDHHLVRQCFRLLLETKAGISVVAEAGDGEEAVRVAKRHKPDVVLMDIKMPKMNGIDATRKIRTALPKTKVLILSMFCTDDLITEALNARASGFLPKECSSEEVFEAITCALKGGVYLNKNISDTLVNGRKGASKGAKKSRFSVLTPRQREVLRTIVDSPNLKEAAIRLDRSVKTVEKHRRQIMKTLGLKSPNDLLKLATREGFAVS